MLIRSVDVICADVDELADVSNRGCVWLSIPDLLRWSKLVNQRLDDFGLHIHDFIVRPSLIEFQAFDECGHSNEWPIIFERMLQTRVDGRIFSVHRTSVGIAKR